LGGRDFTPAGNAVKRFAILKTGFGVAKVVKTFGCVVNTAQPPFSSHFQSREGKKMGVAIATTVMGSTISAG